MTDQQDNQKKNPDPASRPVPSTPPESPVSNARVSGAVRVSAATRAPLEPIVQAAVAKIEDEANRGLQKLPLLSINGWKEYLPNIEEEARRCLDNLLATLDDAAKNALLEVVKERRGKLPLSTEITVQIIGICQSILAFGAGGLALSLAFIDKASNLSVAVQKYLAIAGIFYVELVIVSVLALILYMLQARFRYPFLYFNSIGNAWPWFYYASIQRDVPRSAIQFSRKRLKADELYAQDLITFAEKVLEEDPTERLRNEIQQYFLLMSYQGYVNQFSLRLANFFMYGFVGAFITALIMLLLVGAFGL